MTGWKPILRQITPVAQFVSPMPERALIRLLIESIQEGGNASEFCNGENP